MRGLVSKGRILFEKTARNVSSHHIYLCHETTHWLAEAPGQQFTKDIHGISLPHFDYCGYPEGTHCKPHKANQRTRISRPGHSERGDREVISREWGEAKNISQCQNKNVPVSPMMMYLNKYA